MRSELVSVTAIPAQPGYKLVTGDDWAEDGANLIPEMYLADIVGWQVTTYKRENGTLFSFVEPITMEGADDTDVTILRPDGVVEQPHAAAFEDQAAFAQHLREKASGRNA